MSRQHPTPHEQELRHRFVLMLKAGRDIGLTVDDCIRALSVALDMIPQRVIRIDVSPHNPHDGGIGMPRVVPDIGQA